MKKILVMAPILADWHDIAYVAKSLNFLSKTYQLDFLDPLQSIENCMQMSDFFQRWQEKLLSIQTKYVAFFGFSLGGMVLQHCSAVLAEKPLILCSVPAFANAQLAQRLNEILHLINEKKVIAAINRKNKYVYFPHRMQAIKNVNDLAIAARRMTFGLQCVLTTDMRPVLQKLKQNYLHLIGAQSQLVNLHNVFSAAMCQLKIVPNAGMRVLQDNLQYCLKPILRYLETQSCNT